MKTIIAIAASFGILASAAYAGCGKKVDIKEVKLVGYDKDTKVLTVEPKQKKDLVLTAKAEILDKDGKKAKIEDLVGKQKLVITHEHNKVERVAFTAPKKDDKES